MTEALTMKTHDSKTPEKRKLSEVHQRHLDMMHQTPMTQDERNKLALEMIGYAAKHGGAAFGGYVRDLIRNKEWNDLDLWFKTPDAVAAFFKELHEAKFITWSQTTPDKEAPVTFVVAKPAAHRKEETTLYTFERMIAFVWNDGKKNALMLDVIVSKELPVSDFDCNQVSFDGKEVTPYGLTPNLIEKIKAGRATMLPGYLRRAYTLGTETAICVLLHNRINKMGVYGFKLSTYDTDEKDRKAFASFLSKHPSFIDSEGLYRSLPGTTEERVAPAQGQEPPRVAFSEAGAAYIAAAAEADVGASAGAPAAGAPAGSKPAAKPDDGYGCIVA
ncbi:Hypothetical protein POVN_LOCUS307 [uncultured virus]|nr:Hypothetical protein POVN_LOCUS307 [uncultured virus]